MNNSVFGKTMENVRKRGNFELVHSSKRIQKLFSSRWFKNMIPISNDLVLIEKYTKKVIKKKTSKKRLSMKRLLWKENLKLK